MFKRLQTYASFVRFSHSVFALPFALAGALLALQHEGTDPLSAFPEQGVRPLMRIFWILVAMVAARSAARGLHPAGRRGDSPVWSTPVSTPSIPAPQPVSCRAAP